MVEIALPRFLRLLALNFFAPVAIIKYEPCPQAILKQAGDIGAIADRTFSASRRLFNCVGSMGGLGYDSDEAKRRRKAMSDAYNYGRRKARKLLEGMMGADV